MIDTPQTSVLRLERRGCALVATIDDPTTRNAMSDALLTDFETLVARFQCDEAVRALVLRGNDRIFCAGADLGGKTLGGSEADPRQATVALSIRGARVYAALNAFPKPVIAVVEGAAMGGGMGLASCADIVLAGPNAIFALSEARLGLVAAQIAPFVVARLGLATTRRLALTGSKLNAAQAAAVGLVDELLADRAALDERLDALLADVQACAPAALAATKSLLDGLSGLDLATFAQTAADVFADAVAGEGAEGIAAFKQKRAPAWAIA
ncbi:enoyl-CoA hydratase/isomerase family protein [Sphingomonas sp. TX0543]|uniref:enoyl-CoA hydratase/isomerase family protein n=1 Tax=Sphingomonas sp. TX0543 TaxID=3399682 RepID=UPI003AFAA09F